MSYQVLARKWRPKNFEELVGQNSARQTLTNALSKGRLYPVLIFTGPRGTGKTSTARIVAKSLRCQNKTPQGLPCDKCEDCLSISRGRHLDVIEIDGASNNGVDAVRELRDKVSYMPSTGDWKIYIIDEVHMLSNSAFNALLKTLEEPPKHVMFLMATTESHKIPATVLSRCQKIDFNLLSPLVIKNQLEKICEKESFSLSESLLWILARQAQGSLRDAQSLLDQVITFCGTDVQEEDLRSLLGLSDPQILEEALKALLEGEESQVIPLIAKLRDKSSSPKVFLESLISGLRDLLLLKKNPDNKPALLALSKEEIERKKQLLSLVSYEQLHFLFDILIKGEQEMRLSYDSELVLEVLLLRASSVSQMEQVIPFSPQKNQAQNNLAKTSSIQIETDLPKTSSNKTPNNSSETSSSKLTTQTDLPKTSSNKTQISSSETSSSKLTTQTDLPKTSPNKTQSNSSETSSSKLTTQTDLPKTSPARDSSVSDSSLEGVSFFEKALEFSSYLEKKDPLLNSLVAEGSLKKKSELEFVLCFREKNLALKKRFDEADCHKSLEQALSSFLNLKNQSAKCFYQIEEFLDQTIREKKEKQEKQELQEEAEQDPLFRSVKSVFGDIKIRNIRKN